MQWRSVVAVLPQEVATSARMAKKEANETTRTIGGSKFVKKVAG
jgi:hypothetical protein